MFKVFSFLIILFSGLFALICIGEKDYQTKKLYALFAYGLFVLMFALSVI